MLDRYQGLGQGRLRRKERMDEDLRPGELAEAIELARAGESDAFLYLYLRFAGNVYGYARALLKDEHEAEDITQQVFTKMIISFDSYRPQAVPFAAWLLRITHNLSIDHLRRRRTVPCDEVRIAGGEDDGRRAELARAFREALGRLSDDQREVVVLRHVAGYSPTEIAERLNRSPDSIHGLGHRGRRALRGELERLGAVPVAAAA
jgi:RNA polymerase sigma-70 factor (ECF subfamily)